MLSTALVVKVVDLIFVSPQIYKLCCLSIAVFFVNVFTSKCICRHKDEMMHLNAAENSTEGMCLLHKHE